MNTASWTRVNLDQADTVRNAVVRGVNVSVMISPYDLPRAYRGFYVEPRGVFRIEFRYIDDEPRETRKLNEMVSVEVGIHSEKLLAIEVAVDRHNVDVVSLALKALDNADQAIELLKNKPSVKPSARMNYEAIDDVLENSRTNPGAFAVAQ